MMLLLLLAAARGNCCRTGRAQLTRFLQLSGHGKTTGGLAKTDWSSLIFSTLDPLMTAYVMPEVSSLSYFFGGKFRRESYEGDYLPSSCWNRFSHQLRPSS